MTDAHTPGPWNVACGTSGIILAPSSSGRPDRYEQVIYFDGDTYHYKSPGDAHLIAAAPEMLAALEAQVECTTMMMNKLGGFTPRDIADCTSQARKAIAKARHNSLTSRSGQTAEKSEGM